eukprot:4823185-Pyramimonas_sp.AAC.1
MVLTKKRQHVASPRRTMSVTTTVEAVGPYAYYKRRKVSTRQRKRQQSDDANKRFRVVFMQ